MKNKYTYLIIFILMVTIINFLGIRWGLTSAKLNRLYFSNDDYIAEHIEALRAYPVAEAWKGMGSYLSVNPVEEEKKLPRSCYNPIRSYHPDEYFVVKSLATMKPAQLNFNPNQFTVGGAYLYPAGGLIYIMSKLGIMTLVPDINYYFYHPEEMAKFYIAGRVLTVLYGAGIILIFFLLMAKFTSRKRQSFAGAFLLMFTPLILLNSLYMYVDIPGVFWIMASMYATILFMENFSWRNLFLAGVFAGLACGNKVTFAVSFFLPVAGMFLLRSGWKKLLKGTCFALAGFLGVFAATNPYFFITFPAPLLELGQHTEKVFSGAFYLKSLLYGLGMPLFLFCLTGILIAAILLRRQDASTKKNKILLISWTLFFFVFISLFSKNFARYILPAVPSFVMLGCIGWFGLYEKLRSAYRKILSGLFVIVALWTFSYGMSYKMFFLKENVRTEAGTWMKENIPAGSSIGVTEVPWQLQMPPFDYYKYRVVVTGYDFGKAEKENPDYFILSSFQAELPPYPLKLQEERVAFWKEFASSELYREKKIFQRFPRFAGLTFRKDVLPEDLIYLNPTIAIYERKYEK